MIDLGPHAAFILAAYAVTFVAVGALASFIVADDRRQRHLIAELERKGIKRRSAGAQSGAGKSKSKSKSES
jgi:heme exporter protein D